MTKKLICLIIIMELIFLAPFLAYSQNDSTAIYIKGKGFGFVFSQNGKTVKIVELMAITKTNKEAYKFITKSNSLDVASVFFGTVGGLCLGFSIGYGIGSLISGNKVSMKTFLPIIGVGVAFTVCGIVFRAMSTDNARRGIEIYNNALKQRHNTSGNNLDIGFSPNGVVMKLNF